VEVGDIKEIESVEIQRLSGKDFRSLTIDHDINEKVILARDDQPMEGINKYRAKIILKNQREVLSDEVMVGYANQRDYIVFPNPIDHEEPLKILSSNPEPAIIEIYNTAGQILKRIEFSNELESVSLTELTGGIYFYRVSTEGGVKANGKILIKE
jgi:hypothetical protein